MNFSILINANQNWQHSLSQALSVVQLMNQQGHGVSAVFFYGQAINVLKHPELLSAWQDWQSQTQAKLMMCRTLLEDQAEALATAEQTPGFTPVGMASWLSALESSEKTLELC
mgnify:FL=1